MSGLFFSPANSPVITEFYDAQIVSGYLFGFKEPALISWLEFSRIADLAAISTRLCQVVAPHVPPEFSGSCIDTNVFEDKHIEMATAIGCVVAGMQEAAGIPVSGAANITWARPRLSENADKTVDRDVIQLAIPSLAVLTLKDCLLWIMDVLDDIANAPEKTALSAEQLARFNQAIAKISRFGLSGTNNIRFVRAAYELNIPVIRSSRTIFQYGWGVNSRLLMSSITDETSAIAVTRSKDKLVTSSTLKMAAVPVPQFRPAPNETIAVEAAEEIGYPVVVKPADLDQGVGITANLQNAADVREAYQKAAQFSKHIFVEKHIHGTGFRISVVRDEIFAVVERIPAGVTGDGRSSIVDLVAAVNKDPQRSSSRFSTMKPIVVDAEAERMLAELGMSVDSIPSEGQFIALKAAANISTGGDTVALDKSSVHPSYLAIAKRATALLRLDVSGIDLITTDISKPVKEAGGTILEVNAQPQMGIKKEFRHFHAKILRQYVKGNGSIPVLIVLGGLKDEITRLVRAQSAEMEHQVGSISSEGVYIGANQIGSSYENELAAVKSLLIDPTVESIMLATDGNAFASRGLPLPFFDTLVLTQWRRTAGELKQILSLIKPHLRGDVLVLDDGPDSDPVTQIFSQDHIRVLGTQDEMLKAVNETLL